MQNWVSVRRISANHHEAYHVLTKDANIVVIVCRGSQEG